MFTTRVQGYCVPGLYDNELKNKNKNNLIKILRTKQVTDS